MTSTESLVANVDIFPIVGPAFRNEPALVEMYVSRRLAVLGISTCCEDLREARITDYVRSEFTEKGHKKWTSLLWGTLVVKPQDEKSRRECRDYFQRAFPRDDHFRINAANIRVDADSGTIAVFRWSHEQDEISASEDWYERFIKSHLNVGRRGNF